MIESLLLQRGKKVIQILNKDIGRLAQEKGQRGIQNVRRGQPHVNEAAVLADFFRHGGEKGNDIVLGRLFDLIDPVNIKSCLLLDIFQGGLGDFPPFSHSLAGQNLDIQPLLVPVFRAPDGGHLFSRISRYQCILLSGTVDNFRPIESPFSTRILPIPFLRL